MCYSPLLILDFRIFILISFVYFFYYYWNASWVDLKLLQALALTVVSIGVAVATVTDLQFHFFGACVALAWIIPSAVNKILWSRLQQQENWTALAWVICLFILLVINKYLLYLYNLYHVMTVSQFPVLIYIPISLFCFNCGFSTG